MKNKKWLWFILVAVVLIGGGGLFFWYQAQAARPQATPADVGHYPTPTLFVHGLGGGSGPDKD